MTTNDNSYPGQLQLGRQLPHLRDIEFFVFIAINPSTTTLANKLAHTFLAINRQPLELERCSNPLRIQQVF